MHEEDFRVAPKEDAESPFDESHTVARLRPRWMLNPSYMHRFGLNILAPLSEHTLDY